MQIWAESGKSALPICNYSQILYQFLTFTQNLKRSQYILHNDFSNGDAEGADNDKNVGWTQYESLQDVVDGYNQGNGNPISIIGIKDE